MPVGVLLDGRGWQAPPQTRLGRVCAFPLVSLGVVHRWGLDFVSANASMEVRSRHHLRSDAVEDLCDRLESSLGVDLAAETFEKVELAGEKRDLVLVDGDLLVSYFDGEPFLTVRGANEHPPSRGVVTVDAGAVEFVSDGADVMRPGIVEADEDIEPDDLVVVVEETHRKALAVGRALVPGPEMVGEQGRVVESLHHVGDDLYGVSLT